MEPGCRTALGLAQIPVAGRQGQAVSGTHDGRAHDLDRQAEVVGHLADHRQLLEILLAEYGDIRLYHVQRLGDHRGYAVGMPRPAGTAQPLGDTPEARPWVAR